MARILHRYNNDLSHFVPFSSFKLNMVSSMTVCTMSVQMIEMSFFSFLFLYKIEMPLFLKNNMTHGFSYHAYDDIGITP